MNTNCDYCSRFCVIDNTPDAWEREVHRHNMLLEIHRDNDLPAVILSNGTQKWFQNGKVHRDNDLPAIIWSDGTQEWYQNGKKT